MNPEQALEFLGTLRTNYHLLAGRVDPELMSSEDQERLVVQNPPSRPYLQATWFGRQGFIIAAWSLWDCYSSDLCERLTGRAPHGKGSCVDRVERSLASVNIPFERKDWFSGANALRNIIAHYSCHVVTDNARNFLADARRVAFPQLELFADNYLALQTEHVSSFE
jgi:hypothetical protein